MSVPTVASTFRYLRLKANSSGFGNYCECSVKYLVGATSYPTSAMTTNSAPSPLVALADSEFSGSYQAWQAFDNNVSTFWSASPTSFPHWVQIDLGSGNAITPTAIVIAPSNTVTMVPYDFVILGSNTGSFSGEETTLYSAAPGASGWSANTDRTFTF